MNLICIFQSHYAETLAFPRVVILPSKVTLMNNINRSESLGLSASLNTLSIQMGLNTSPSRDILAI